MKKEVAMNQYAGEGKRIIRVSYTPNTWLEVDKNLSDEEIKKKVNNFKQLTGIK